MLDFIENWISENISRGESAILCRLYKTAGEADSILVSLVSDFGEAELYVWEDGRLDAVLFKSDGEETSSARFILTSNYQDFVASLLAQMIWQLERKESGTAL